MKRPRISFIIHSLGSGGAERVVTTLANELCNHYEILIITFIKGDSFYPLDPAIRTFHCLEYIEPSKTLISAVRGNFLLFKRLRTIIIENHVDLLIGFMTSANVLAVLASRSVGIPVIISERNNPNKQQTAVYWKVLRRITYPLADYVVVQTNGIKDYFKAKIKASRLQIIPNPIAPQLKKNRNDHISKQNIILNVGSLTTQKAQHVLIKAFSLIKTDDWVLVIAGEGPERKKLTDLVKELGLEKRIYLPGRTKEVHNMYNKSKIFAFSSLFEGTPNALIEAMYYGLPCVSTDCPTGPSELIENGTNGYLVPVDDVNMLAEKLSMLVADENKRNLFGRRAQKTVEPFEVGRVAKMWHHLILKSLKEYGTE